jgi:5-methyltetrahydrofolate--homocysteine methyltransferase
MPRKYTNRRYLDALDHRVLIYDGAMGTSLQNQKLTAEHFGGEQYNGCNDYLVLSYPAAVEKVHRSFFEVGVDVVETDTFRANRLTLDEYGLGAQTLEINRTAATLARKVADEFTTDEQPRYVAGSIGPSGKLPSTDDPDLSDVDFDDLVEIFREQALGLIQGGVDVLLIETSQDILEVKAVIHGIVAAFSETGEYLPIQCQVTLDTTGRMLLGTDAEAALTILEGLPIDVIGLNCSTGPEHMRAPIEFLGANSTLPVSAIPNAGLPLNVDGEAVYPLEPEPFAVAMTEFIEKHNIAVVGGCCGTTPEHLKLLVEKVHGRPVPPRPATRNAQLASGVQAIDLAQDPPPFIIGERCNAQGSRKFKRLLLAEDWDAIVEIARGQVDYGAHALDISVAVTENLDEVGLMTAAVKKLINQVPVPLVIDTTEPEVLEAALKTAPGRCMVNSTHLESGREKADQIFALVKAHNATVMVLTIDEAGMAKTADRKIEVAKRIYDIGVNDHGLRPGDLIFDALTFTLATGDPEFADSAAATIEGIKQIKAELPGVFTSLGVSNLSFGFSAQARPVLNSVFLYYCVQAGLDMAIINPVHITPYADIPANEIELSEDLIFNRRPDALQRYIEYFENIDPISEDSTIDPTEGMTTAERLHWRIVQRHKDGVVADIDELLNTQVELEKIWLVIDEFRSEKDLDNPTQHDRAVHVLNTVLLPAMKEVGDKFGAGELILPFVLQSAEVMKKAVGHLETYLETAEGVTKGTVILATVYGDVHDIGKNLVKTILSNNGYTVIDLGKQVPAETIITAAVENNADAIGLSALLVSTSKQMTLIVNELHRRGLEFPVLVGGAAINRRFGRRINQTDDQEIYKSGVYYCKDAFEGLETMDAWTNPNSRPQLLKALQKDVNHELGRKSKPIKKTTRQRSTLTPSPLSPDRFALGPKVVRDMPLEIIFQHLYKNELFRLSWGAKNARGDEWTKIQADFEARLTQMQKEALKNGWLQPQAVYGYWPCQSDGDDLVILNPDNRTEALTRFAFPRQPSGENLCLADYFAPSDSGQYDLVSFQVVTVGQTATTRFDALQDAGDFSEAYYFHGLAVQTAEATAEYLHQHIRRELGLPAGQGKRYSWGYPAIPDLDDHQKVFELLPAESELGMMLTSAFQLVPEQSTAAIIIPHKDAKYYTVGTSRVEQLMQG